MCTYLLTLSVVLLSFAGPMIEISRKQMVYNAGSHLEVSCSYRNTTNKNEEENKDKDSEVQRVLDAARRRGRYFPRDVPEDTIVWTHDGSRFSHRNRRRFVPEILHQLITRLYSIDLFTVL